MAAICLQSFLFYKCMSRKTFWVSGFVNSKNDISQSSKLSRQSSKEFAGVNKVPDI